ncbi:hypothetical protein CDES_11330 [Corynebacterium deserti GIMN1.010]|uniref:DUF3817 domain-containing protein n=2 Tax=Corynebacterium TaxID=1716 RepID=A0A0M4CZG2_9CORY|nr:DUF3817 domain-containing protein [Corynebacterium deserti]ALC06632.1 hypothetical protein CDES_11330 [Corynebacterium deserti GIMN1.010]
MSTNIQVHPERKKRVRQALNMFSVAAWVTGVFLLALVVRMIMQYGLNMELPSWATFIAIFHGWAYIIYLLTTLNLGLKARWNPARWITTAIAGVVPLLSFFIEHNRRKEVTETFQLNS